MFRIYDVVEIESEPVVQEFNLLNEVPYVVKGFYPYIYMKNRPDDSLFFTLKKDGVTIFEKAFDSDYIMESLETSDHNAYVFLPIIPVHPYLLLGRGRYRAEIKKSGTPASEGSHIGWIRIIDFPVNDYVEFPQSDSEIPFAMKIKVLERT